MGRCFAPIAPPALFAEWRDYPLADLEMTSSPSKKRLLITTLVFIFDGLDVIVHQADLIVDNNSIFDAIRFDNLSWARASESAWCRLGHIVNVFRALNSQQNNCTKAGSQMRHQGIRPKFVFAVVTYRRE